jgi:hypothetical protein
LTGDTDTCLIIQVTGAASDFVLAILPWFYIGKLNIGLKEKISIGLVMSTGIFATACSILKIYYTSTLGPRTDYSCKSTPRLPRLSHSCRAQRLKANLPAQSIRSPSLSGPA